MIRLLCVLLLLTPTLASAQIAGAVQIGNVLSKEELDKAKAELDKAKQIVDSNKDTPLNWNKGEFQLVERGTKAAGPLFPVAADESILGIKEIAPDTRLIVDGVRVGDTVAKEHDFPAQKQVYWRFKTLKEGSTTVWIFANGEAGKPPVVIDKMRIVVGKPAPDVPPDDPVVPVDDELTKGMRTAFAKDKVAGIGDTKWLLPMAGIFEAASKDSLDTVKTAGDLDNLLYAARVAAGVPDPDKTLSETRQFIKRQLQANLTGGVDAPATVLDAAKKTTAKTLMGKIADSLEKIAK
jgi:hypothetical protein